MFSLTPTGLLLDSRGKRKYVTPGSLMVRGNRNYFYLFPLYTSTTFLHPLIKSYVILRRYSFFLQTPSENALILQLISAAQCFTFTFNLFRE